MTGAATSRTVVLENLRKNPSSSKEDLTILVVEGETGAVVRRPRPAEAPVPVSPDRTSQPNEPPPQGDPWGSIPSLAMSGLRVIRWGTERLRVGPWRGDDRLAYLAPVAETPPATPGLVNHCCDVLAGEGYRAVVTGALGRGEQQGFLLAGFAVREELHLLSRPLDDLPAVPAAPLRRGHRHDRQEVLAIDTLAFPPFWRLDDSGLSEAMGATRSARFRVAAGSRVLGYAVSGRSGTRGYLQRLAVDPEVEGRGLGRALVVDGLRWMRRRGASQVVVNTQVGNERALALYQHLGFQLEAMGLAVLTRPLEDRELTP